MKKKILATLLSSLLFINIFVVNAFAQGQHVDQGSSGTMSNPGSTSSGSSSSKPSNKNNGYGGGSSHETGSSSTGSETQSEPGSSKDNPIVNYAEPVEGWVSQYEAFRNDGRTTGNYSGSQVLGWSSGTPYYYWTTNYGKVTWHLTYLPQIKFVKDSSTVVTSVERKTDYYKWTYTTPKQSGTLKGQKNLTWKFDCVGNYHFESTEHIEVKTHHKTTNTCKAYIYYSNGHTSTLRNDSYSFVPNPDPVITEDWGTHLEWNFYVTPEEIGPHKIGPDVVNPKAKTKDNIKWDTQMIR